AGASHATEIGQGAAAFKSKPRPVPIYLRLTELIGLSGFHGRRRGRRGDRALALTDLRFENLAHQLQREEMGVNQRQQAVLVDLAQLVTAQVAQLFLVH
ncbi:hypothetical protein EV30_14905, partial [Staphylococcus aureus]